MSDTNTNTVNAETASAVASTMALVLPKDVNINMTHGETRSVELRTMVKNVVVGEELAYLRRSIAENDAAQTVIQKKLPGASKAVETLAKDQIAEIETADTKVSTALEDITDGYKALGYKITTSIEYTDVVYIPRVGVEINSNFEMKVLQKRGAESSRYESGRQISVPLRVKAGKEVVEAFNAREALIEESGRLCKERSDLATQLANIHHTSMEADAAIAENELQSLGKGDQLAAVKKTMAEKRQSAMLIGGKK